MTFLSYNLASCPTFQYFRSGLKIVTKLNFIFNLQQVWLFGLYQVRASAQMSRREMNIAKMADWVDKGTVPHRVFNKFDLKTMQRAILNCLQVSDVLASLPTGFGKSLLFQYPASLQKINSTCIIVIVPLKALLWDTIREATELGIIAQQIDKGVIKNYNTHDKLPQMLLATPEKIFASQETFNFIESLQLQKKVRLLVIDECHCMSEWGHDFRPAYLELDKLRSALSGVRLLAISATITPQIRGYLSQRLFLHTGNYFQASYHRSNLFYAVLKCKQKAEFKISILNYLKDKNIENQFGIIYCQTITAAENLTNQLESAHLRVGLFHSKLSENMRKQTYDNFMSGKIKIIVGTICFGMGINKTNIRFVINVGVSKSPENYYQESGRAGRDGLQAHCVIISFPAQINSISFLIGKGTGSNKQKSHQLLKLHQIQQYSAEQTECRRTALFRKLGENFNSQLCEKMCDICSMDMEKNIKKLDFFKEASKILEDLQTTKKNFTKKQLISFLKGKSVNSQKRGKSSQLNLGEEIKGLLSKQKLQTIQKIIDAMISKQLIVRHLQNPKSRYLISYYKAANRNSTRNLKQFFIAVPLPASLKKQESTEKVNKFDRFLQKKGASDLKPLNKIQSLDQLAQKKSSSQILIEADVVKVKQDYQSFFSDLFGDQLSSDFEIKPNGEQVSFEADEEQREQLQTVQEYQDVQYQIQELDKKQQCFNADPQSKTQTLFLPKLQQKPKIENLKRNVVDPKKFQNGQS